MNQNKIDNDVFNEAYQEIIKQNQGKTDEIKDLEQLITTTICLYYEKLLLKMEMLDQEKILDFLNISQQESVWSPWYNKFKKQDWEKFCQLEWTSWANHFCDWDAENSTIKQAIIDQLKLQNQPTQMQDYFAKNEVPILIQENLYRIDQWFWSFLEAKITTIILEITQTFDFWNSEKKHQFEMTREDTKRLTSFTDDIFYCCNQINNQLVMSNKSFFDQTKWAQILEKPQDYYEKTKKDPFKSTPDLLKLDEKINRNVMILIHPQVYDCLSKRDQRFIYKIRTAYNVVVTPLIEVRQMIFLAKNDQNWLTDPVFLMIDRKFFSAYKREIKREIRRKKRATKQLWKRFIKPVKITKVWNLKFEVGKNGKLRKI